MIPDLHFIKNPDMKVLPAIRENFGRKGGKVVLYQRVTSVVLISWETTHLEWIPPYSSRSWAGLRHAFWTSFLGWWSWHGLYSTPAAILTDVFGGVDVTELVNERPGHRATDPIAKAQAVLQNRGYYMLIIELILFFAGVMLFVAYAPVKWLPKNR